jgi:2,3-bisphosphoglycerate-dependent phosphoglycerate mutase
MAFRYVVLARHAQSEANRGLQKSSCGLYYSLCGSDPEVPLTDDGLQQADQLGELLNRLFPSDRRLMRVYENRYLRIQQTTNRVLQRLSYGIERENHDLLEKRRYGKFWNLTRRGVRELFPDEWERYQQQGDLLYRAPEGGENYPDVFQRVDRFIDERVEPCDENLLIITSSVVALAFQRRFESISDDEVVRRYEESAVANGGVLIYCRAGDSPWQPCDARSLAQRNQNDNHD